MNEKILKSIFYGCLTVFVGVLAFFILYNAQWIVGDDAIIIGHTGWGNFFNPADTINPSGGRFYPLAYIVYNILPVFGLTSAGAHFSLHFIAFLIFSLGSAWAILKAVNPQNNIWKYIVSFAAVAICIQRGYNSFLDGFSTIWVDYTLLMIWVLCTYFVHTKQSKTALVVGLIALTYLTYCLEANFVLPLCYGIIGLCFTWKSSSKLERIYLIGVLATAIVFLIVYFFTCYIHIEEAYDGSHGSEVTLLGNAIKMFIAQKVLWVGLIVFGWRMYRILFKKEQYEFWDTMIIAAFGFCCGCAILKLNWVMYYTMASLFMVPALAHYMTQYLNEKIAAALLVALALFMCRTLPKYVKENQNWRNNTTKMMTDLEEQYKEGVTFYWYEPTDNREWCFDMEFRAWLREAMQTQLGWQVGDKQLILNIITEFDENSLKPGIYMVSKQNDKLFPGINEQVLNAGDCMTEDKERDIQCIKIN